MKVLVVDDNSLNRKLLRTILAAEGHSVVEAEDGQAALDVLQRDHVDAVMSDILMPRMDGYRLCYEIRKNERLRTIPFIACTATYDSPKDEKLALDFGADKFLWKLEAPEVIVKALNEAVERTRGRHAKQLKEPQELLVMREYSETLVRKLEERNLELAEANKTLVERARLAEFNSDTNIALTHKGTLPEILQLCAEAMVGHLDAAFARIWTFNPKADFLELKASAGLYTHIDGGHACVPVGQYKIGLIASERQPHLTNSVIGDSRVHDQEWAKREGMVAFAGYPLIIEDQLVGVMAMFARKPLTPSTLQAMESVSKAIATGILLKWTDEEKQRNLERIRALHEIDRAISSTLDLNATLVILQKTIPKFVPSIIASTVRLMDKESGKLDPASCWNLSENEWRAHVKSGRMTLAEKVFESQRPLTILNVEKDSAHPADFARKYGLTSYLGVPLSAKEKRLGVLGLYTKEQHEFTNQEIEFLNTLAGQAAIAIHNARLYEETERRRREAEELARVAKSLTEILDMQAVGERIVTSVREFFGVQGSTLRLRQADGSFRRLASSGEVFSQTSAGDAVPSGVGLTNRAITEGKPIWSRDILNDPEIVLTDEMRDYQIRSGNSSMIVVPLRAHEKLIGTLTLSDRTGRIYPDSEVALLQTFADQAALALENARLFEEIGHSNTELEKTTQYLARTLKQLGGLYTALSPITPAASTQEMVGGIIERLIDATSADGALIRVWDKKADRYPIISQRGFPDSYLKAVEAVPSVPSGGAVDWVVKHGQPIIAPDIASESRFKGKIQLQLGLRSCAMLPLTVDDEVRGVMHIASRKLGYFDKEQRDHLLAIARQISIALENRELFYDLKSSRDELERSNKVKDEFLSVMSHELRTPLNVIMGYTGLLKEAMLGEINPEQMDATSKIMGQCMDLLVMVNSILQATQLGSADTKVFRSECSLSDLLDELKSSYAIPQAKELTISWDYPAMLPTVKTDEEKLKHILQNLINNAVKFTEKGQVVISARVIDGGMQEGENRKQVAESSEPLPAVDDQQGAWLEFQVADTGVGIPQEQLPVIFDMFRQVDSSETRPYGGTGLGLYIVKKYLELLGGKVEVESELGKGSTFTVVIPCEAEIDSFQPTEEPVARPGR
jgi:signal transduction histidine kinase/CheY-like chemotaxis protein